MAGEKYEVTHTLVSTSKQVKEGDKVIGHERKDFKMGEEVSAQDIADAGADLRFLVEKGALTYLKGTGDGEPDFGPPVIDAVQGTDPVPPSVVPLVTPALNEADVLRASIAAQQSRLAALDAQGAAKAPSGFEDELAITMGGGPQTRVTARNLIAAGYGDRAAIQKASADQLQDINGVGAQSAQRLKEHYGSGVKEPSGEPPVV